MPSTVIRSFEYDPVRNELTVTFTTERVYVYSLVPPPVADAFRAAVSKGEFFNQNIRDRYPFRKAGQKSAGPSLWRSE
ncbi:MAG: KTSC domain-containing protein [Bauldia sp.]